MKTIHEFRTISMRLSKEDCDALLASLKKTWEQLEANPRCEVDGHYASLADEMYNLYKYVEHCVYLDWDW